MANPKTRAKEEGKEQKRREVAVDTMAMYSPHIQTVTMTSKWEEAAEEEAEEEEGGASLEEAGAGVGIAEVVMGVGAGVEVDVVEAEEGEINFKCNYAF